jgi:hypothetical protein
VPRKKTTVSILANLEVMSRDTSLPETVRAEAAKEYVRLKAKEQQAPAPAAPAPVPRPEPDWSELKAAFQEIAKSKPANPESETQTFAHDAEVSGRPFPVEPVKPEPVQRQKGSTWILHGREYMYLGMDAENKLHMLTETRSTAHVGQPEVVKVNEDTLIGRRHVVRPKASRGNVETVEQCKARRWREMQQDRLEWQALGGRSGGDPEGC